MYSNAAFANIALVAPSALKRSAADRKLDAVSGRQSETRLKQKVDQANTILDRLEARSAELAQLIKALQKRKAATAAKSERLEDAILTMMDSAGIKTITGLRCSMSSRPSAEALEIQDESLIPRIYFNTPKTPPATPDKVAIKKALGQSEDLDPAVWGCKLTSKVSLIRK